MSKEQTDFFLGIGTRLEKVRKSLELSKRAFSKLLGLTESYYGQMSRGVNKTTVLAIYNLLENEPNFSADWIITGKGEMIKKDLEDNLDVQIIKLTAERDLLLKILNDKRDES